MSFLLANGKSLPTISTCGCDSWQWQSLGFCYIIEEPYGIIVVRECILMCTLYITYTNTRLYGLLSPSLTPSEVGIMQVEYDV